MGVDTESWELGGRMAFGVDDEGWKFGGRITRWPKGLKSEKERCKLCGRIGDSITTLGVKVVAEWTTFGGRMTVALLDVLLVRFRSELLSWEGVELGGRTVFLATAGDAVV